MYPLVYLAKVLCLNPVHKYILGKGQNVGLPTVVYPKKIILSNNTRFPMYFLARWPRGEFLYGGVFWGLDSFLWPNY
jgi:hypothetical protein